MYGVQGDFRRFCFDRAVFTFGRALEAELNSLKAKTEKQVETKRSRMLAIWLDQPVKYRTPTATTSPTAGATVETMSTKVTGGM